MDNKRWRRRLHGFLINIHHLLIMFITINLWSYDIDDQLLNWSIYIGEAERFQDFKPSLTATNLGSLASIQNYQSLQIIIIQISRCLYERVPMRTTLPSHISNFQGESLTDCRWFRQKQAYFYLNTCLQHSKRQARLAFTWMATCIQPFLHKIESQWLKWLLHLQNACWWHFQIRPHYNFIFPRI